MSVSVTATQQTQFIRNVSLKVTCDQVTNISNKDQQYSQISLMILTDTTLGTRGFSRVRREFSVLAAGHYKDLSETGNRARKVSSTQG